MGNRAINTLEAFNIVPSSGTATSRVRHHYWLAQAIGTLQPLTFCHLHKPKFAIKPGSATLSLGTH